MHTLRKHKPSGFTLIEMAISILLVGLAVASLSPLYKLYIRNQQIQKTNDTIENATYSLGEFRLIYGRYPCPASLTATRTDTNYGHELCSDMSSITPGESQDGVFIQNSLRAPFEFDDPYDGLDTKVTASPRVRIGFLPFRQLGIDENSAYDGYGQRLMYAVTEHLTNSKSFRPYDGGIEILNDEGASILSTPNDNFSSTETANAHFVIFSYGETGEGAYSSGGNRLPCDTDIESKQTTNCDFSDGQAVFRIAQASENEHDVDQFDDKMAYFTPADIPMWQLSETTGDQGDIHHKAEGNFGLLNSEDEEIEEEAQVDGTIRAQDDTDTTTSEGRIAANNICDDSTKNCFSSTLFAGKLEDTSGGMTCEDGEFMAGIENGAPICTDEVVVRCEDDTTFLVGVEEDGTPICSEPTEKCEPETVTLCGESHVLPQTSNNKSYTVAAGDCRFQKYTCEETTWEKSGAPWGQCEYDEDYIYSTQVRQCEWAHSAYSGTYTRYWTLNCLGGNNSYTHTFDEDCTCHNTTDPDDENCPGDLEGDGIRRHRTFNCSTEEWSDWVIDSEDCHCYNEKDTQKDPCPPGYDGYILNEYDYICDSDSDTSRTKVFRREISRNCKCIGKVEERDLECSAGLTGAITQQRTKYCDGSYSSWETVGDTCRTCSWQISGTSAPSKNVTRWMPHQGKSCTCGRPNSPCYVTQTSTEYPYRIYSSCQCK